MPGESPLLPSLEVVVVVVVEMVGMVGLLRTAVPPLEADLEKKGMVMES